MNDAPEGRMEALHEQARRGLQFLLNFLFANAEQALIGMAAKSDSNAGQSSCYEAMRELRLKRRAIEEQFLLKTLAGFDGIGAAPPAASAPDMATPPETEAGVAGLGVMQDTLLEERIAIDSIASRALHANHELLVQLGKRVAVELGERRFDIDALPVAPLALTNAFMAACRDSHVDQRSRMLFARLFSQFVVDQLGLFYEQCLAVFPEPESPATRAPVVVPAPHVPQALPTSQVGDEFADPLAQAAPVPPEIGWDLARTPLLATPGKAMAMPKTLMDEILATLQRQLMDRKTQLGALNPRAGIQPFDVFELINAELEQLGFIRTMALPPDVIEGINLVRMLFEHALRDSQVPQPVRRIVRLLQIPLLRAALRDPGVLDDGGHPVRALCREIGTASIGWAPEGDTENDEFLRFVQLLVIRVISDFDRDLEIFRECLEDLRRHAKARQGPARVLEQRTLAAETGRVEAQAAREVIAQLIGGATADIALPKVVTGFLRGKWSDALFVIRLRDGAGSEEWAQAVEATGRLIALAGAETPAGDFAPVAAGVRMGLARLGLDEATVESMLADVESALGANKVAAPGTSPARPVRAAASPRFVQIADKLAPDTWIEFRMPGVTTHRARLLTKIPRTGQFLFVTREGAKASDWSLEELALAIEHGEAVILGSAGGSAPPSHGIPGRR